MQIGIDNNYMTSCMDLTAWILLHFEETLLFLYGYYTIIFETLWAGVAQLVELQPSKLDVASSSLVSRSRMPT